MSTCHYCLSSVIQFGRIRQLINVMASSAKASPVLPLHFAFFESDTPFHKGPRLLCVWFHPVQHQIMIEIVIYYIVCIIILICNLVEEPPRNFASTSHTPSNQPGFCNQYIYILNHNSGRVTANVRSTGRASKCGKKNSMSPVSTHRA